MITGDQFKPPWEEGTNGLGHMTKMAAAPIYGKNLLTSSRTGSPMILKLGM